MLRRSRPQILMLEVDPNGAIAMEEHMQVGHMSDAGLATLAQACPDLQVSGRALARDDVNKCAILCPRLYNLCFDAVLVALARICV